MFNNVLLKFLLLVRLIEGSLLLYIAIISSRVFSSYYLYQRILNQLGEADKTPKMTALDNRIHDDILVPVKKSITAIAKRLPWHTTCFIRAYAVSQVLKYFRVPYVVYFGVARIQAQKIKAHAWVTSYETDVVGGEIKQEYTIIDYHGSSFS